MRDPAMAADGVEARVNGTMRYAIDLAVPGMVHAALVRSPAPAARLRAVMTARAETMPGVLRIVTAADLDGLGLADRRFGSVIPDQPILAEGRVRHIGEPVAVVVASSAAEAWAAAAAVGLDLQAERAVEDADAALAAGAPLVHEDRPGNILGQVGFSHGDLAAAERMTVHRSAGWFTSPAAQHVSLEPQVCVAHWTDAGLELWAATQSPSRIAAELARVFGLEADRVRLHVPPLGGGYGGKNHAKLEPLVAAVAALVGLPVRLVNRRVDEFVTTTKHPARTWIESGVDADARFTFRRARIVWDAGAYAHSSPAVMRAGMLAVCGPYRVPAAEVESVMVYTNVAPGGSFRGLGANQAAWAGERQVDMLARELGLDPVELRRRNVVHSGDRLPTGERVTGAHWSACLEAAAASLASRPAAAPGSDRRTGTGIALAMKHTMTPSRSEAIVAALADGTVEVRSSLVDMGQGLPGVLAAAAADCLGLPPERIRVIAPDTLLTPFDATTSSSRGTWSGTTAVRRAAEALRDRLEVVAAEHLGVPRGSVALGSDWAVHVGGEDGGGARAVPAAVLAAAAEDSELIGHGIAVNEPPLDPETGSPASSSHWHQGAVAVRVTVDTGTGVTRVVEAHGAAWAGRVVNARGARLQNEGNILTGLGPTLFESLELATGGFSPRDLLDYRIPSILDVPDRLETTALEADPGARDGPDGEPTGLGESLIPAVAPAVAAAIAEAVDVELTDLPLDPTRILAAIRADPTLARSSAERGRPWVSPTPPTPGLRGPLSLTVDGQPVRLKVDPWSPLATVLSEALDHRAVRQPCGVGACGACTAVVDGRAVRTCLRPAGLAQGATIVTAGGLADDDPVRRAFIEAGAAQCGFCIPAMVLVARTALERAPDLDADGIRAALAGNLCRCGTYAGVLAAVAAAAGPERA